MDDLAILNTKKWRLKQQSLCKLIKDNSRSFTADKKICEPLNFWLKPESKKLNLRTVAFIKRNLELKMEKFLIFFTFLCLTQHW